MSETKIQQAANPLAVKSWAFYALLVFGAVCVGSGIVSIVAANWEYIPYGAKEVVMLALLGAFGYCYISCIEKKHPKIAEVFLILFYLGCVAYIGLIIQIFNFDMPLSRGFLFWCLVSLPLPVLSQRMFIRVAWVLTAMISLLAEIANNEWLEVFLNSLRYGSTPVAVSILTVFLIFIVWQGVSLFLSRAKLNDGWLTCIMVIVIMCYTSTLDMLSRHFKDYSFGYFSEGASYESSHQVSFVITSILLFAVSMFIAAARKKTVYMPVIALFMLLLTGETLFHIAPIYYALISVFMLLVLAVYFASENLKGWFTLFFIISGLRIFGLYFQYIDSLIDKGIGFIVLGLFIMGFAALWYRVERKIAADIASKKKP